MHTRGRTPARSMLPEMLSQDCRNERGNGDTGNIGVRVSGNALVTLTVTLPVIQRPLAVRWAVRRLRLCQDHMSSILSLNR